MYSPFFLVLSQILPIILPPLIGASISGAFMLYQSFVQRLPSNLHARATQIANQVVESVEQSMSGASGQAKKAAAEQYINSILAGLHLSVPAQLVDSAIESAVFSLNQFKAASLPAPLPAAQPAIVAPSSTTSADSSKG